MNPALWGALSSLSFGTADFMARFSSRSIGYMSTWLGVLAVGCVVLTGWIFGADVKLTWSPVAWHLIIISGASATITTLLLYKGLARGPISLVAPIVCSHPVLILALAVMFGARPTPVEWAAMILTIVGVVIVARSTPGDAATDALQSRAELNVTTRIAIGSMIAYAVWVFAGQRAVPVYGELQTLWMARLVSLTLVIVIMLVTRQRPNLPVRIWPFLIVQGGLDTLGYLALFTGSSGTGSEITAVVASTFGIVTVLLAWMILKERMSAVQWVGIIMIFSCVAVLTG